MPKDRKNTSKPRSIVKLQKALAGLQEHFERHPRDAMTATRIVNMNNRIKGGGK